MIRAISLLLLLVACGVDGPPVAPEEPEAPFETGISVTGSAEIGVSGAL